MKLSKIVTCIILSFCPLVLAYFGKQWGFKKDSDKCFCQLSGSIDDCCCTVQDVNKLNSIYVNARISHITKRDYFRYIRLHLKRKCPFWPDLSQCAMKDCSVDKCNVDELPEMLKIHHAATFENKYSKAANTPCSVDDDNLGALNETITDDQMKFLSGWSTYYGEESYCVKLDEDSIEAEWIDLVSNPEQYTGYQGHSAHTIWNAIYKENCFLPTKKIGSYDEFHKTFLSKTCLEKRVFYRIVSGMHSSINIHLSYHHPVSKGLPTLTPIMKPNPEIFHQRFHPDTTKGRGPYWLKNLYFTYLLVLRAITKAEPYWRDISFYTGKSKEDREMKQVILDLVSSTKSCPSTFDESQMFAGDVTKAEQLKFEVREHFKNITRIMDCVGCERCKIWGKIQTTGIAAAMKILFSSDEWESVPFVNGKPFSLTRTEIVSLFQSLSKFSNSLLYLDKFKKEYDKMFKK